MINRRSLDDPMPILTLFVTWEPAVHPKLVAACGPFRSRAPALPASEGPSRSSSGPLPRSVQVRVPTRPATVLPPTRTRRVLSLPTPDRDSRMIGAGED